MEKTNDTIEQYLETLDPKHREVLQEIIDLIYKVAPDIGYSVWRGVFWGGSEQTILGFGEYEYQTKSGASGTWFLIGLARQKAYYSLYVTALQDGEYITKKYQDKLGKVKAGSSNIRFTKLENVNLDVLREMLSEAVATLDK